MDLYGLGLFLDKRDEALLTMGFAIPRFEICSDAIKLDRPEGAIEFIGLKAFRNGGMILKLE